MGAGKDEDCESVGMVEDFGLSEEWRGCIQSDINFAGAYVYDWCMAQLNKERHALNSSF